MSDNALRLSPAEAATEPRRAANRAGVARGPMPCEGRLDLGALATLVSVRFFTEVVHVLPRATTCLDVPCYVLLVMVAAAKPRDPAAGLDGRIQFLPPAHGPKKEQLLASTAGLLFPPAWEEGHPRIVLEAICRESPSSRRTAP